MELPTKDLYERDVKVYSEYWFSSINFGGRGVSEEFFSNRVEISHHGEFIGYLSDVDVEEFMKNFIEVTNYYVFKTNNVPVLKSILEESNSDQGLSFLSRSELKQIMWLIEFFT